jgi:hypothetical protein
VYGRKKRGILSLFCHHHSVTAEAATTTTTTTTFSLFPGTLFGKDKPEIEMDWKRLGHWANVRVATVCHWNELNKNGGETLIKKITLRCPRLGPKPEKYLYSLIQLLLFSR